MAYPPQQNSIPRSMGYNYGRVNPANGRRNAQAATYTSNVTGAPIAGGMQNMPNGVQPQQWFNVQQPPSQTGGAGGFSGYGQAIRQMMENHRAQSGGDPGFWIGGQQTPAERGMRTAEWNEARDRRPGDDQMQTLEWNEARDRRPGDDVPQLLGAQQSAVFQPQQVLKQMPQGPANLMRGVGEGAIKGVGQIVGGVGRAGENLGEFLFGSQQQPSAVQDPQQGAMSDASIADYMGSQPQQQQMQPWVSRGANQARQGGAPMAKGEMDSLQARLAQAEQQAAQAKHQRTYREHGANVQDWLGGRLAGDQIAAAQGGSQQYNTARGRGTPEQEAAFQSQIAQGQNRDANREFAMTPGGAEMDRFRQLAAMQSNIHGGQQAGDDTQANLRAMREKGYGDIIMHTRDGRLGLTSRGNKARRVRQQETGDVTGQMKHNGQMISAATAPEYQDAAARNRERINRRREERGGMSERQARDISRRANNPRALEAYAIRNGLENNAMVQSMMSGQGPSAVHGSQGATQQTSYSSAEQAAATEQAAYGRAGSAYAQSAGFSEPGMNHFDTSMAILEHDQPANFTNLQEWATIHKSENEASPEYSKLPEGSATMKPVMAGMNELADLVNNGNQKKAMEKFAEIQKQFHEIRDKAMTESAVGLDMTMP